MTDSFFIRVELVAGNDSTDKSTYSHLSIVEVETEESLGQANSLRSSNHVSKILKEIKSVIELFLIDGSSLSLEIVDLSFIKVLSLWSIVCLQLRFFFRSLKDLDHDSDNWENEPKEPEKGGTLSSFSHIYILEELNLCKDLDVIKDPIKEKAQPCQDVQYLFMLRCFLCVQLHYFLVLNYTFAEAEKLSRVSHALYIKSLEIKSKWLYPLGPRILQQVPYLTLLDYAWWFLNHTEWPCRAYRDPLYFKYNATSGFTYQSGWGK